MERAAEVTRIATEEQVKIDAALTIYYKDVIDSSGNIDNFDVALKLMPELETPEWSVIDTPANSGTLINGNQAEAIYRNPDKGGIYVFELDEDVSETTTRAQMWLPVAGPDITSYWSSEVARIRTWGATYRSNLHARAVAKVGYDPVALIFFKNLSRKQDLFRNTSEDFSFGLSLDWEIADLGVMYSNGYPAGLADVYTEDDSAGDNQRLTICGKVVDFAKRNNMGYALIAKEMGFYRPVVIYGPEYFRKYTQNGSEVGAPDSAAALESYHAGCDLSDGISLSTVMNNRGLRMLHPGMRTEKEWPSSEITSAGLQLYSPANTVMEELINE